jgi:putative hydrolase of the HAD superfamily
VDKITTLFWDVGGVLLSNGWDTDARRRATDEFGLDWDQFQERHELVSAEFEKGQLTLDEYLQCTVFYCRQGCTPEAFKQFMFAQSQPLNESMQLAGRLAASNGYLMATINNESRDLNLHRIQQFNLGLHFSAFFSSCFLGIKKPERGIYQTALEVSQRRPEECVFIDDRALNVEGARRLGIHAVHFQEPAQLQKDLARLGVEVKAG